MINRAQIFSVSFFIGILIFFYATFAEWTSTPIECYIAALLAVSASMMVHSSIRAFLVAGSRELEVWLSVVGSVLIFIMIVYGQFNEPPSYGSDDTPYVIWFVLCIIGGFCGLVMSNLMPELPSKVADSDNLALSTWSLLVMSPWLVELWDDYDGYYFMAFGGIFASGIFFIALLYTQLRVAMKWRTLPTYTKCVFLISLLIPLTALVAALYTTTYLLRN